MAFDIIPVLPGMPFYNKFKSYARMLVEVTNNFQMGDVLDESNCIVIHHWCRNVTRLLSIEEKSKFKKIASEACLFANTVPWDAGIKQRIFEMLYNA